MLFKLKGTDNPGFSTPFSEFIRTASSETKKKVYSKVLQRASENQNGLIARTNQKLQR